jgi:hypothetical protein
MEQRPSDEAVLVVESLVITQWQQVCYELLTDLKHGYQPFPV